MLNYRDEDSIKTIGRCSKGMREYQFENYFVNKISLSAEKTFSQLTRAILEHLN